MYSLAFFLLLIIITFRFALESEANAKTNERTHTQLHACVKCWLLLPKNKEKAAARKRSDSHHTIVFATLISEFDYATVQQCSTCYSSCVDLNTKIKQRRRKREKSRKRKALLYVVITDFYVIAMEVSVCVCVCCGKLCYPSKITTTTTTKNNYIYLILFLIFCLLL